MYRNLAASLLVHETVRTTLPKAKELRRVVEPLITLAKEDSVSRRRLAFDRLRDDEAVGELFKELGPRFKSRPGGYLRILQDGLPRRRLGADGDRAAARSAREGRRAEGTAHDGVSPLVVSERKAKPAVPQGQRAFSFWRACSAEAIFCAANLADSLRGARRLDGSDGCEPLRCA